MGQLQSSSLSSGYGYRIIAIEPNSYGSNLNLEIFLDYIIQIHNEDSANSKVNPVTLLESDIPIQLKIFNLYTQQSRDIYISEPRSQSKLGLQIRMESYIDPVMLHVTNVLPNSPASQCGLVSNLDFVLGMISHKYESINEFSDLITGMAYRKQQIQLCLFSPQLKKGPTIVVLEPRFNWGGPGALGCEFASGAMHTFTTISGVPNTKPILDIESEKEIILDLQVKHQELIQQVDDRHQIGKFEVNQVIEAHENSQQLNIPLQTEASDITIVDPQQSKHSKITNQIQNSPERQENYETPTMQQEITDSNTEQGVEIHKFKGIPRFNADKISIDKEEYQYKESQVHDSQNGSFQSKNASSDYSHIQPNYQDNVQISKVDNDEVAQVQSQQESHIKYSNNLTFKSSKREQLYQIDKTLLFDLGYQHEGNTLNLY